MNMEQNKILAAILVAGIAASLSGFVAKKAVHPEHLAENSYKIEGVVASAATGGGAPAAPAKAEPIADLIASADLGQGEKVSKVCASCHTFEKGGPNRVGPNLSGIVGAKHAHADGFAYSDAMKAKAGETWTEDALNEFLWNPKQAIPGTKMGFAGVKKPEDRAALIKWMKTQK
mgnify:CR=1 FL=1